MRRVILRSHYSGENSRKKFCENVAEKTIELFGLTMYSALLCSFRWQRSRGDRPGVRRLRRGGPPRHGRRLAEASFERAVEDLERSCGRSARIGSPSGSNVALFLLICEQKLTVATFHDLRTQSLFCSAYVLPLFARSGIYDLHLYITCERKGKSVVLFEECR